MIHHSYHYDKDKRFRILKNNIQICGEYLFFSITILILSAVFSLIFPSFTPVFRNDVSSITLYERENEMSFTVGGILSRIGSGNWTANLQCVNETDESARIIDIVLDNNRSRVTFVIM